jgi:cobalamin biosynthesis protein CbiG
MKLYYTPGACSLADHIALTEAGIEVDTVKVDLTRRTEQDDASLCVVHPQLATISLMGGHANENEMVARPRGQGAECCAHG